MGKAKNRHSGEGNPDPERQTERVFSHLWVLDFIYRYNHASVDDIIVKVKLSRVTKKTNGRDKAGA